MIGYPLKKNWTLSGRKYFKRSQRVGKTICQGVEISLWLVPFTPEGIKPIPVIYANSEEPGIFTFGKDESDALAAWEAKYRDSNAPSALKSSIDVIFAHTRT